MGAGARGVAVWGSRSSREFSQEDQSLFRTMANRVAALIAQARLDAEVTRRAAELEAVLAAIPEAIYVGDATRIKHANAAALEMFGYRRLEDLNKDVATLVEQIPTRYLDGTPVPPDELVHIKARHGRGLPIFAVEADLLQLCQQVIDGMQVLHPDRALQLSSAGDTVTTVDPDRATQVIANLVGNAILYSPAGSPVRVTLRNEEDAVVLEVNNQGAPIPEETLPGIFEPFHRGAADGGGSHAGLGLRRDVASQIAEAH